MPQCPPDPRFQVRSLLSTFLQSAQRGLLNEQQGLLAEGLYFIKQAESSLKFSMAPAFSFFKQLKTRHLRAINSLVTHSRAADKTAAGARQCE